MEALAEEAMAFDKDGKDLRDTIPLITKFLKFSRKLGRALLRERAVLKYIMDTDNQKSMDEKVQRALECPCVANLRSGPCGTQFTDAFSCFLRSTAEEKGSDCVSPFVALQNCIKASPHAFSKDVLEEEEPDKEEIIASERYMKAPTWARETAPPKSKI